MKMIFIIDFDSTLVTIEALDALARISLEKDVDKDKKTEEISEITRKTMEGALDFPTSLALRFALFKPNKQAVEKLIELLKQHITPSAKRNINFFSEFRDHIYIVSGGFKEYILPIAVELGLKPENILANNFVFDKKGEIAGYNTKNPLAQIDGKVKAVEKLGVKGEICVIGDGITDYQIVERGVANHFFAFCENIYRKGVVAKADRVIKSFDELLYAFDLPRSQSYPTSKMKVLLLEGISEDAVNKFREQGYQVEEIKGSLTEIELAEKMKDISILGIRSKTEINKNILEKAENLLTIGAFCIGTNQIDLAKAAKHGIGVFNAPYSNTRSVVELTFGEIIMLMRGVFDKSRGMHEGKWNKSAKNNFEIRGKTLGIIGYGNIGSQLSVLAESAGMRVYFYDIADKLALGNAQKTQTLRELLQVSDVVSVHVDGAATNKNLIGAREFSFMKKGVIFLNLSRGHIVDIQALYRAIKAGIVGGTGVDVFPVEPKNNSEPFVSVLQNLPNVILTPHVGGSTEEAQKNIGEFVSSKLIQYMNTGNTVLSCNMPNLSLPAQKDAHRFIHIHENRPGILMQINKLIGEQKVNIEGQYLKTNEEIGYVITDINKNYNKNLIEKMHSIPGTIRLRVLY